MGTFTSKTGTALAKGLAVTPQTVGDVLVVFAEVETTGPTVSSVSGGGVATWTKGGAVRRDRRGRRRDLVRQDHHHRIRHRLLHVVELHLPGTRAEYGAQEFSAGLGANTVWALDKSGTTNGASSTTVPFPSLTPSGTGELYFGYAQVANTAAKGTTSGFTYAVTTNGNAVDLRPQRVGCGGTERHPVPGGGLDLGGRAPFRLGRHAATGRPTVTGVSPDTGPNSGRQTPSPSPAPASPGPPR